MKQIEKLKVEDVKPSSRQYPYIRFLVEPKEKLHRLAVEAKGLAKATEGQESFREVDLSIEAGERWRSSGRTASGRRRCCDALRGT